MRIRGEKGRESKTQCANRNAKTCNVFSEVDAINAGGCLVFDIINALSADVMFDFRSWCGPTVR